MKHGEIEFRPPVLESETAKEFDYESIEHEWRLVTEAIKREIIFDQKIRKALLEFLQAPLSETLPQEILSKVSEVNRRVGALISRYSNSLERFTRLPAVPNEQITPDIQNVRSLYTLDEKIAYLEKHYGVNTPKFEKELQRHVERGSFTRGITAEERLLVAMRYRFARDLKTLCLGAELIENPVTQESNGQEVILPSGIKIMVDSPYSQYGVELFNPITWESRKQLKDRVYEVTAKGHKYILKERKTPKHLHQKKGGYVKPLTSIEEFNIAKDLNQNGRVEWGRIDVEWERPIGYAEFPDGFQFAIFEYDSLVKSLQPPDGFNDSNGRGVEVVLRREIIEKREQFEAEYQIVSRLTEEKFIYSPEAQVGNSSTSESVLLFIVKLIKKQNLRPVKLSFEYFAKMKALRMIEQAENLLKTAQQALGYSNTDHDGFVCYVPEDKTVKLRITGFDFEYFRAGEEKPDHKDYFQRIAQGLHYYVKRDRSSSLPSIGFEPMSKIQVATYLALLHLEQNRLEKYLS